MEFTQVGKYKILAEIGQGSMGQVFRAHDPILGRDVALKTISAKVGADEEMRKRFHREAQAAARLNHPNIITVHDFGEEEGCIYIAMELLDGVDLKDFIASGALKSMGARLEVMNQILEALSFAHSRGIVHRDLKPANIHVLRTGKLKLMDFGLARIGSATDTTQAGTVLGTPNYMSPEQVLGERADFRSDVFSAGAVFYEVLAGRKPFDADSVHAVLFQVVHKDPLSLRRCAPEIPPPLVAVVEKALAKDAAQRFKDAGELKAALGRARASISGVRPPATTGSGVRPPAVAAATPASAAAETAPLAPSDEEDPEATMAVPGIPRVDGSGALASEVQAVPRPGPSSATLPAKVSTQIDPSRSRPPAPTQPMVPLDHGRWRRLVPLVLLLGLASGIGAAYFFLQALAPPAPTPTPATGPDVRALTRTLAGTQVQLAQRVLEDKDYKAAMAQAEEALKLEPGNAAAREVLEKASAALRDLEVAAREAAAAVDAGETERAADALSRILALDPQYPAATELTARLNGVFLAKAEAARKLASDARTEAEKEKAESVEPFGRAAQRAREAEASFGKNEFASATQGFLEARDAFDRARRTAATRAVAAARPQPAPQPKRDEAQPPAAGASRAAPPEPATPPAAAPLTLPRALVAGRTTVESARTGGSGLAGFESEDVSVRKTPDFLGRIEFEVRPAAVKAGDAYAIRIALVNDGRKDIEVRGVKLTATVNGNASTQDIEPAVAKLTRYQRTTVAQLGGVWEDHVATWSLDVVVTSSKGDACRSRLELK